MDIAKIVTTVALIFIIFPRDTVAQIRTDNDFLLKFAERKAKEDEQREQRVKKFIDKNLLQKHKILEDGTAIELFDVIDEQPIYLFPLGIEQVETVQSDELWPGYDLGLNITGEGYDRIGLWIGNDYYTLSDHNEFTGRMTIEDDGGDYPLPHDTAIAGILMAEGVNNNAKGVAYKCSLKVYRKGNMLSEVAIAALDGMEITSYSWATPSCYSSFEASIDTITYKAPHYLFFQAAGNTSSSSLYGQGKNSLSVGSTYSLSSPYTGPADVILGNTHQGPAVDGRIKPDIMAPGGHFTSVKDVADYGYLGPATSYSTPVAAGVGVLLQQHYQDTHNYNSMYASELKCLLIHTADEAGGADGPDYTFGWGLINAKRAANFITLDSFNKDIIDNQILNDGNTYQKSFYTDGTKPIKVTICWTDPPSYASYCGNLAPRLINDLDLKIIKDGVTFYPWTLDPSNSSSYASNNTKNYLDNIEQVYISEPSEGIYTIQVTNDGNLSNDGYFTSGTQLFSTIVSGNSVCNSGEIIYNSDTETFNFCKDGMWIERKFAN